MLTIGGFRAKDKVEGYSAKNKVERYSAKSKHGVEIAVPLPLLASKTVASDKDEEGKYEEGDD